ncbi:hypothetical protein BLNAU_14005 [Blattamonas nauphoetae]|uniref:Uncharacterized protein n=1 Tax=Blattamonas nauphoetae TaxID=2049346 RepID=A0ABQ9XHX6_9EUKA|nr:hypothetical protein BLNAU_14005 [Blattamonas nauphoetae]
MFLTRIPLIFIDPRHCYRLDEFAQTQGLWRCKMKLKMTSMSHELQDLLRNAFTPFKDDSDPTIKVYWDEYLKLIDSMILDDLHLSVKRSLTDLMYALVGDKKAELSPLYVVEAILAGQKTEWNPAIKNLKKMVFIVREESIMSAQAFPRVFTENKKKIGNLTISTDNAKQVDHVLAAPSNHDTIELNSIEFKQTYNGMLVLAELRAQNKDPDAMTECQCGGDDRELSPTRPTLPVELLPSSSEFIVSIPPRFVIVGHGTITILSGTLSQLTRGVGVGRVTTDAGQVNIDKFMVGDLKLEEEQTLIQAVSLLDDVQLGLNILQVLNTNNQYSFDPVLVETV